MLDFDMESVSMNEYRIETLLSLRSKSASVKSFILSAS